MRPKQRHPNVLKAGQMQIEISAKTYPRRIDQTTLKPKLRKGPIKSIKLSLAKQPPKPPTPPTAS
jgi:hypothetical protein